MTDLSEFDRYMSTLCDRLGHADRREGLRITRVG